MSQQQQVYHIPNKPLKDTPIITPELITTLYLGAIFMHCPTKRGCATTSFFTTIPIFYLSPATEVKSEFVL